MLEATFINPYSTILKKHVACLEKLQVPINIHTLQASLYITSSDLFWGGGGGGEPGGKKPFPHNPPPPTGFFLALKIVNYNNNICNNYS